MVHRGQLQRQDETLHVLFGKAFLLELELGDLETAAVFARAFVLRTTSMAKHQKRHIQPRRSSRFSIVETASSLTASADRAPSRTAKRRDLASRS